MSVSQEVIDRLSELDTPAVSDALDSMGLTGVLSGVTARVPGAKTCGLAFTVTYRQAGGGPKFRNAANYLDDVPAGSVVVVDNGGDTSCTNWGSLLTAVARAKGVRGTVLHGSARDIAEVRAAGYPLFSTGVTMVSGKNRVELSETGADVDVHGVLVRPGDVIIADDKELLHIDNHLVAGVVILSVQGVGGLSQLAFTTLSGRSASTAGCVALIAGMATVSGSVFLACAGLFLVGAAVTGIGFGLAFMGGTRLVTQAAPAHQRGQVLASFFVVAYLAISVPVIGAGAVSTHIGLSATFYVFAAVMAVVALITLISTQLSKR